MGARGPPDARAGPQGGGAGTSSPLRLGAVGSQRCPGGPGRAGPRAPDAPFVAGSVRRGCAVPPGSAGAAGRGPAGEGGSLPVNRPRLRERPPARRRAEEQDERPCAWSVPPVICGFGSSPAPGGSAAASGVGPRDFFLEAPVWPGGRGGHGEGSPALSTPRRQRTASDRHAGPAAPHAPALPGPAQAPPPRPAGLSPPRAPAPTPPPFPSSLPLSPPGAPSPLLPLAVGSLAPSWSRIQARKSGVFSHLTRVSINSARAPANPRTEGKRRLINDQLFQSRPAIIALVAFMITR